MPPARKADARQAACEYLSGDLPVPVLVRVNPERSHLTYDGLASVLPFMPDGIVLPKSERGEVSQMVARTSDSRG